MNNTPDPKCEVVGCDRPAVRRIQTTTAPKQEFYLCKNHDWEWRTKSMLYGGSELILEPRVQPLTGL